MELLVRDHVATVREEISREEELVRPLFDSIRTEDETSGTALSGEDWRKSVEEMFGSVQKVEEDVRRLLAGSSDTLGSPERLSRDLQLSITKARVQLWGLSDQVSSPFLSIPPSGSVPAQDEVGKSKEEKP